MNHPARFTPAELRRAAKVAKETGLIVELASDGGVRFIPVLKEHQGKAALSELDAWRGKRDERKAAAGVESSRRTAAGGNEAEENVPYDGPSEVCLSTLSGCKQQH